MSNRIEEGPEMDSNTKGMVQQWIEKPKYSGTIIINLNNEHYEGDMNELTVSLIDKSGCEKTN